MLRHFLRRARLAALPMLVLVAGTCGTTAHATPIVLTFSAADAAVAGGAIIDLSIEFTTDTALFQPAGNPFGGGLYSGLHGVISSTALGLNHVQTLNTLSVYFRVPNLGLNDFVGISDGSAVGGVFSGPGTLSAWDGVSNFGLSGLGSAVTGALTFNLANGNTLTLGTFDDSTNPANGGGFTAALQEVPEPATLVLVGAALGGLAVQRRHGARGGRQRQASAAV